MNCYKELHVITSIIFNLMMLIIVFSSDRPMLILLIIGALFAVFLASGNLKTMLKGLAVFIPFLIMTFVINMLFVQQGSTILLTIGSKEITLEALIYSGLLSLKLLIVIYIFQCLSLMIDSDRAVSFFSSVMPKSTLTLMISLKLFPQMKKRTSSLKEIYSIRGVEFGGKTIKSKLQAYLPVLSVILEDSLEKSFDIGEAVFARGFLSSKRSVYDRQKFKVHDYIIIVCCIITLLTYFISILGAAASADLMREDLVMTILFSVLYAELILIYKRLVVK